MVRTRKTIIHHGRSGRPVIHIAKNGRRYIMVRAKGGGVKRLYEGSKHITSGSRVETLRL